ncbi:MAG: LamG domain-containing protein, partial [Planctomycetes bacterium]|nr:LamG domain-containing protein [Planctomycetota bacterium]
TPASAGQWQYRGLMDDVRIYSYALSRYEVADLYLELSEAERLCLEADSPTLRFDFNDDCVVNLADFAIFAADWLNCQIYPDCLP